MKKFLLFSGLSCLSLLALSGCATEVVNDEPTPAPVSNSVKFQFHVSTNDFTRSSDDNINSLHIAFIKSGATPELINVVKATENGANYTAELEVIPNKEPDMVIAFANIPDVTAAKSSLLSEKISELTNDGNFIMSSAVYFDNGKVVGSQINTSSEETVEIYLDRAAAKVSVKLAETPDLKKEDVYNANGEKTSLTLTLDNWGLTAVDKETYLIKEVNLYNEEWNLNKKDNHFISWANSVSYNKSFPGYNGDLSNVSSASYLTFSAVSNSFGDEIFSHESTRIATLKDTPNALPSVILSGHYTIGSSETPATFYRVNTSIFTEEELISYMTGKLPELSELNISGTPSFKLVKAPAKIDSKNIASNYVTLALESLPDESDGNLDDINAMIAKACGVAEMFSDGKCWFKVPVVHNEGHNLYGLVRNHFYTLTVNGIEGLGNGVANADDYVSDQPDMEDKDPYKVSLKFNVKVNGWEGINQDISITKK